MLPDGQPPGTKLVQFPGRGHVRWNPNIVIPTTVWHGICAPLTQNMVFSPGRADCCVNGHWAVGWLAMGRIAGRRTGGWGGHHVIAHVAGSAA